MNILNRKLLLIFASFTLGVFLYQYSLSFSILLFLSALILLKFTGKRGLILIIASVFFFTGGMFTTLTERYNISKVSPIADKKVSISGTIISIPEEEAYGQSAICKTPYGKIKITIPNSKLRYKDTVTFVSTCRFPESNSRPFDFDYSMYLKSKGIYLISSVSDIKVTGNIKNNLNPVDAITTMRESALKRSTELWSGETLMFARSILMGETSLSSDTFREKLSSAGISHIIAVSGTHVSMFCSVIFLILARFSSRKRYAVLFTVPMIIIFTLFTGASSSAVRAAVMMAIYVLASASLSHYDPLTALATASFFILIINPFAAFSLSYILSFSAILGIHLFLPCFEKMFSKLPFKKFTGIISVTLSAQISTAPVSALYFGKIPFLSLLANIPAIPLVPFIMLFGYLSLIFTFIPALSYIFSEIGALLINLCIKIAENFSKLPLASFYPVFRNNIIMFLCILFFLAVCTSFFVLRKKKSSIVLLSMFILTLTLNYLLPFIDGRATVSFVDAEHGDFTLAVNQNHSLIIDCISNDNNFVKNTVTPVLHQNGIYSVDVIAVTEYNEYDENILASIKAINPKTVILPKDSSCQALSEYAFTNGVRLVFVSSGDSFDLGNIKLYVPFSAENFCSYYVLNEATSFLFPGNIEQKYEDDLASAVSHCNILKSPRHGNKGSCSSELLKATTPDTIIVSTGRKLSEDFSERLKNYPVYSTKISGDITVNCKTREIKPYKKVK